MVSEFSRHVMMRNIRRLPSSTLLISALSDDVLVEKGDKDPLIVAEHLSDTHLSNSHPNLHHSLVEN